jgi:3-hydroxypropanoate dehydrogenase
MTPNPCDGNAALAQATAERNSALQGAYLILAARALGIDSGAQSAFNPAAVNEAFFPDGRFRANFLINLGYADHSATFPRGPRLTFDQAAQVA